MKSNNRAPPDVQLIIKTRRIMKEKIKLHKLGNMLMLVMLLATIFAQPMYGASEIASEIASSQVSEVEETEVETSEVASEVASEVSSETSETEISETEENTIEENAPPVKQENNSVVSEAEKSEADVVIDSSDLSQMTTEELEAFFSDDNNSQVAFIDTADYTLPKSFKLKVTPVISDYGLEYFNSSMWGEWSIYKVGGKFVFCVEPGVNTLDSATSTSESGSLYYKFSTSTKRYIGRVISSSMQRYSDTDNLDYLFAGQLLIWEYLSDHESDLLPSMYGSYNAHRDSGYLSEVKKIDSDLSKWTVRPSFMGSTSANAKGHILKYNQSTNTFSTTLTDTNGVWDSKFANYGDFGNYTVTNPAGANNVKVSTSKESTSYTSAKQYLWKPYSSGEAEFYDAGQDLVYVGSDPVPAYMKFKTEAKPLGGFKIKKIDSETGKALRGAEFTLYQDDNNNDTIDSGDSKVDTYTTNASGLISVGEILPEGDYTLKETKAPANYKLSNAVHSIHITAGKVSDYTSNPFENEIYKGGFKVKKVDSETNAPLQGAEFTLYNPSGSKYKTYTTNENGIISSGKTLRPGRYTLVETKAPVGYVLDETEHSISIVADKISDYSESNPFENDIIRGGFELTKLGEIFQLDNEALAGIEFTVTSTTYPDFNKVYTTDENGQIITADDELKYGNYHIEETKAPSKYVIDFEQDFSIKKDGVIVQLNGGEDIINKLYLNKIHGLKVAENFDNTDNEIYSLAGTTFGIYEELGTPNGEVDRQDHLIDLQVTDENGEFTSVELPEGSYVLKEIEPTEGYNLNETNYPFEINNDGTLETHSTIEMETIENEVITGKAQLIKVGSKLCDKSQSKPDEIKDCQTLLPDVSFAVYQDLNNNGVFDKQESKPVQVIKTDKDGLAVTEDLKYGHYFVKEVNNPANNYFMNENTFEFTIDEQDELVFINNGVAIENVEKLGNIHITKSGNEIGNLNDETVLLEDAEYTIYNSKGEVEDVLTTDSKGEATSIMLSFGDYTMKETKAPVGYALDETKYEFTIDEDSYANTIEFELTDEVIENEMSILKTDLASGEELPGAELNIIEDNGSGTIIDTWTSTTEAHVINLEYGDYIITETITPEGYLPLAEAVRFSVTEDGIKQELKIDNELITNEMHVKKTDFATGEEIPGAHLKVINTDTEETVEKWTSTDEEHVFTLPYGNYMVIETIAPDGYQRLDQGVKFEVTEDGVVQHLAIENKLMEMAVTGGNNLIYVAIGVLLVILVALLVAKKKNKKEVK